MNVASMNAYAFQQSATSQSTTEKVSRERRERHVQFMMDFALRDGGDWRAILELAKVPTDTATLVSLRAERPEDDDSSGRPDFTLTYREEDGGDLQRLLVELKVDAPFGEGQVGGYLKSLSTTERLLILKPSWKQLEIPHDADPRVLVRDYRGLSQMRPGTTLEIAALVGEEIGWVSPVPLPDTVAALQDSTATEEFLLAIRAFKRLTDSAGQSTSGQSVQRIAWRFSRSKGYNYPYLEGGVTGDKWGFTFEPFGSEFGSPIWVHNNKLSYVSPGLSVARIDAAADADIRELRVALSDAAGDAEAATRAVEHFNGSGPNQELSESFYEAGAILWETFSRCARDLLAAEWQRGTNVDGSLNMRFTRGAQSLSLQLSLQEWRENRRPFSYCIDGEQHELPEVPTEGGPRDFIDSVVDRLIRETTRSAP